MSVALLVPANSQRSRSTAIKSFEDFLSKKQITLAEAQERIANDLTVKKVGRQGVALSKNTVLSYFGNVKNWLADLYPQQSHCVAKKLQNMLSTLDRYCEKRPEQAVTKQAPPCTKKDIKIIISALYMHASASSDYLDAALVVLMWYLYGRGSEAEQLEKAQLCVYPGGMIFLRFKRVKTASQQGISLFKDPKDAFTCPLHVLAVAISLQSAPGARIFPQFVSTTAVKTPATHSDEEEVGLLALLDRELEEPRSCTASQPLRSNTAPGAQAYINRLLVSVSQLPSAQNTGLTKGLTSHSFRRGGAMHANADSRISPNWVVERGGWNMSRVSKAFSYMLNTTQEDQQVARQLSGWCPQKGAYLPDLSSLEAVVKARVERLQALLFSAVTGFSTPSWNIDPQVLEVLMASLFLHFPEMQRHRPNSPYVLRIHEAFSAVDVQLSELLAWSLSLRTAFDASPKEKQLAGDQTSTSVSDALTKLSHQIDEVLVRQIRVEERLAVLESTCGLASKGGSIEKNLLHERPEFAGVPAQSQPKRARKRASKALATAWFEWFTATPPLYQSTNVSKAVLHETKYAVAYMMLCLPHGFQLDPKSPAYKTEVHALGVEAERRTLEFLQARGSQAASVGSVVKAMRAMQKEGDLRHLLQQYQDNFHEGHVVDPTPSAALPPFLRFA